MNSNVLKEKLQQEIGFEVALPYRKIPSLKDRSTPIDVKAWVVEFVEDNLKQGNQLIDKIFSANKKNQVLMGRMRVVLMYSKCTTREMAVATRMHKRQEAFIKRTETLTTQDICYLDTKDTDMQNPLQQMILCILRRNKPENKLFFNVELKSETTRLVIFCFHPTVNGQAVAMLKELLQYLTHTYNHGVEHFFNKAHRISCQDMKWDPKNHGVWIKRVEEMEQALEEDVDNWKNLGKVKAASSTGMEVDTVPKPSGSTNPVIFGARSFDGESRTCPSISNVKDDKAQSKPSKKAPPMTLNSN